MRSDADRIAKYIAKYVPTTVGLKVAERLTGMKSGYTGWTAFIVPYEQQIQGILDLNGTCIIEYPFYYAFGREIAAASRLGISGPALLAIATNLYAKYVSFGYTALVLKKIALDVFNITIP